MTLTKGLFRLALYAVSGVLVASAVYNITIGTPYINYGTMFLVAAVAAKWAESLR